MKGININQTIDKMVKDKFLTIYKEAINAAESKFKTDIQKAIKNLSAFEKIKFLNNSMDGLNEKINALPVNSYAKSVGNEDYLLKIFSSRSTLLNLDDSDILTTSIYLSHFKSLLSDSLIAVKDELPKYSFQDFESGVVDDVFFKLNYTWHLKEGDLNQIRRWQIEKMVPMHTLETARIVSGLKSKFKDSNDFESVFKVDIETYQQITFPSTISDTETLCEMFGKLSFMHGYDFSLLSDQSALNDFNYFLEHEINWNRISPLTVNDARTRFTNVSGDHPIIFSPIIFYVVEQIINWMKDVINGKKLEDSFLKSDLKSLAEKAIKEEEHKADAILDSFELEINKHSKSNDEKINSCLKVLDKIRVEMNNLNEIEKQYFASIHRSEVDHVFTVNALIFDADLHEKALRQAARVYFEYLNFSSAYYNFTGKHNIVFDGINNDTNPNEIFYIASTMVVDNELQDRLSNVYNEALQNIISYTFPIDFVYKTMKEEIHQIFLECVDKLQTYLEDCIPGNKVLYIQSRLKELRQRELKLNSLSKLHNDPIDYGYTTLLKEYLQIEADFITSTKDIHFFDNLAETPAKKEISTTQKETKILDSFGYKSKDHNKLFDFVSHLTLKIDFLNTHKTSIQNLVDVLTSHDLKQQTLPEIHLACETTQLSYIFKRLELYFTKLNKANIENSKLFFTKTGKPLKAQNLSASKIENPKEQVEIDRAFSLLQ